MKFADIVQFPFSGYNINVELAYLKDTLEQWDCRSSKSPLIMNPEWQRGHVWTVEQQTSFLEYFLKGGTTGRDIYFNCSSWQGEYNTPIFCLDGLQRITAALNFLDNNVPVFGGNYFNDFTDKSRMCDARFNFHMLKVKNKKELLSVYYQFNSGGTPHNPAELERIRLMIENTKEDKVL